MREKNIDWLVLIAALAVVAIHVPVYFPAGEDFYLKFVVEGICKAAVPIFFAVAGYFFAKHLDERGWWRNAVKRKLVTLFVPYLFWSVAYAVVTIFMKGDIPSLGNVLGVNILQMPHFFPLWFVRNLLLLIVVSPAIVPLLVRKKSAVLMLSVCFVLEAISFGTNRLLPGNSLWCGIMYFSLGIVVRRYGLLTSLPMKCGRLFIAGAIALFAIGARLSNKLPVEMPAYALARLLMTIGLWQILPNRQLPSLMTDGGAFPVYVLHVFILMVFAVIIPKSAFAGWHAQLLMSVMVFFASYIIGWGMKKLCPRFSAIVFGGR